MLLYIVKKVFGTRNDRVLKSIQPLVERVNSLGSSFSKLSDDELRSWTGKFRERLERGESLESIEPEAFAVAREAAMRAIGLRPFDVQLIGGAVLHRGMIAEMKTGEGKTLVASLSAYLNALPGKGVHVVTVNDYLAKRDSEWMGQVYNFMGLSCGVVYSGMDERKKKSAYQADITYGQNNEFGFDYLRDNMKFSVDDMLQRSHYYAIVDEVDSILIDEARTPLIISGPAEDATDRYYKVNAIIPKLEKDKDFQTELRTKTPSLTEKGVVHAEQLLGVENLYDPSNIELLHHVHQALKAYTTLERDVDYVVKDGQIIIVDEFTGRLMPGRRWSNGLHQAVEAREGLPIMRENRTLASITFQNYFRMYDKLSGMTGTADTEAVEFQQIYNLEVIVMPPNRVMRRQDGSDQVYRNRKDKYDAVARDIAEVHKTGQPILVGTISIEQSEALSARLTREGVPHNVLNAKHHEREAEIVAQAGRYGAVTISTNMAGRGTDIVLGGNPQFLAYAEANTKDQADPTYVEAFNKYKTICEEEKGNVVNAGGLFVIGTERHEARRIDNQLRGRSGRQGDPGKSRFYISLEDDLMVRFGGDKMQMLMKRLGWEEGVSIDGNLISRSIETAQKRVEAMHFESRKHVTEYDDVMNKQRQVIYNLRNQVLSGDGIREEIFDMIDDLIEDMITVACDESISPTEWDLDALKKRYQFLFNKTVEFPDTMELQQQVIFDVLRESARPVYEERSKEKESKLEGLRRLSIQENGPVDFDSDIPTYKELERRTLLEAIDYFWNAHLQDMDHLREGIGLRGYGQKNPLYEYQKEGFVLFQAMLLQLKEAVIRKLSYEDIVDPDTVLKALHEQEERRKSVEEHMTLRHDSVLGEEEDGGDASNQPRSPEEQRSKLEAQKKQRRKMRR